MPLIVITGYPSSGKSKRCKELQQYFSEQGKEVHIVNENEEILKAGFEINNYYKDSLKEKHIRGLLKSEVSKLITSNNLVILDGSNYIKGYRYELYCVTKSNRCTQCTVYTIINKDEAWILNANRLNDNEKYDREAFDGLIMRYEEPEAKNRWDSPLFFVMSDKELEFKVISECLFDKKAPPLNMSTQNAPLSSTNYLFDLNKILKEITMALVTIVNKGNQRVVSIPGYKNLHIDLSKADSQKLIGLSRQYLTYSKMHTPDIDQVPKLYVQYLKSNLA